MRNSLFLWTPNTVASVTLLCLLTPFTVVDLTVDNPGAKSVRLSTESKIGKNMKLPVVATDLLTNSTLRLCLGHQTDVNFAEKTWGPRFASTTVTTPVSSVVCSVTSATLPWGYSETTYKHLKTQLTIFLGMIDKDTPSKLAEIIRDTWPQLHRPLKKLSHKP